jgi:surface antigen
MRALGGFVVRLARRLIALTAMTAISLTVPVAAPTPALAACAAGSGQIAVYSESNYTGTCTVYNRGVYPTLGTMDNTILSIDIGPATSDGYKTNVFACQDPSFGGSCRSFSSDVSDLPYIPLYASNFHNTISSLRVRRYASSLWSGFSRPQCTWGAALEAGLQLGVYPGWHGNANQWDENAAQQAFWLVNDTPAPYSIVNMEAGNVRTVAKGWSGPTDGGSPVSVITGWPDDTTFGHVAFVINVYTTASGVTWIESLETNVQTNPSGWTRDYHDGAYFWHIWTRYSTAGDKDSMSIIHWIY